MSLDAYRRYVTVDVDSIMKLVENQERIIADNASEKATSENL